MNHFPYHGAALAGKFRGWAEIRCPAGVGRDLPPDRAQFVLQRGHVMKSRCSLIVTWAVVLVALGLMAPSARAAVGLTGVINSVDVEGRKLVVTPSETSGTEKSVTVTVTDQTRITTAQGQPLRLADVKPNDTVGI